MAKIQQPPKFPPDDAQSFVEALVKYREAGTVEQGGKYLHWEELRRRTALPSITLEQWWHLIKLARSKLQRAIPLTDRASQRRFTFAMTDTIQQQVHEIDRDASGRIELPEDVTNAATRDRYIVSGLIEEAIRSSQLEGASTTRAVAKEMIRTGRAPRTTSERMILNNYYGMEWVREHRSAPLTIEAVFELHAIVTRDTLDEKDGSGRFRRADEPVHVVDSSTDDVVHTPPDASELPIRMAAMCEFANATSGPFIHPVVRSILVHFWLAYDHPFVDGNGRTARLLFYWSMLRHGYWLTEFISISRAIKNARSQYDRAYLFTETDDNDTTYFLLNQLKMLRTAIDELFFYLRKKAQEVRDVETRLRDHADLNHRQLAVLSHALRQPDARFMIESHRMSHRVVYQTARTDLLMLAERGFLEQGKVGKQMVFTPARDLQRKLGRPKR